MLVLGCVLAWVVGGIPFGLVLVRVLRGVDIRTIGSGNVGATNASRAFGKARLPVFLLIYVLLYNIKDHSGIVLTSRLPWQGSSRFHDDHHVYFHCNYGQNLPIFDKLHGTHRRVNRRYGEDVFGGKGAPLEGGGNDDEPEWVEY